MALCPYCNIEIHGDNLKAEKVSKKAFKFDIEMYSCPHCNAVLGFASAG
jgi:uncharacterized protein with PIN domain